jgi:hypothetical protein
MKEIKLTKCQVALVDDEDFEKLSKFTWYAQKRPYTYYAQSSIKINGKWKRLHMHREILGLSRDDCRIADHIDRDGLNNRRSNLRIVNKSINNLNSRMFCNNESGYRGVYKQKDCNRWRASISKNKKAFYIGLYKTPELAALAYNYRAIIMHGENARLNTIYEVSHD